MSHIVKLTHNAANKRSFSNNSNETDIKSWLSQKR